MPGYVIHLAVAQEYLKKHKENNENFNEFIAGAIAPDGTPDKSLTHYGEKSSKVNLSIYLKQNEINTSYDRGYFLHLVTDYLFYNKYLDFFAKDIYNDYDILNKYLIQKYNVKIPSKVEDRIFFKEGKTVVLSKEIANKVIDEISSIDLKELEEAIRRNPNAKEWNTYKNLHKDNKDQDYER